MGAAAQSDVEVPVPLVDLSPFMAGEPEGSRAVVADIARACEATGFLVLVGHGVDRVLIAEMYDVTKAFFHLPLDEKLRSRPPSPDVFRGYRPPMSAALARSLDNESPPDLVESFVVNGLGGAPAPPSMPERWARFYHDNIWPERPAEMRDVWHRYYRRMEDLAATVMELFALALDLPADWFADKADRHRTNLLANYYPPQAEAPAPNQLRRGAHTDYGSLTILYQDDAPGGLEIQQRDGSWHAVASVPGSFVVNIGDLMERWTNDRWRSTMHRVVNPPLDLASSERLTIPFFHIPNLDLVIEPIPTCVDDDHPSRYPPVTTADWFLDKHLKTVGS